MSNIFQFKPRAVAPPQPPVVEEVPQQSELPAQVVGYSINDTAAAQVVQTLLFYARQGWDDGMKAKQALLAMRTVVEAKV